VLGDLDSRALRDYSRRPDPASCRGIADPSAYGLPKGLPKLRSSQSIEQNSEHLAELKAPANNSHHLNSARCKAVHTGSIPVVALVLPANRRLWCGQPLFHP
jgi:hypothetical protein